MNVPSWRSNVLIFAALFVLVIGSLFWQERVALRQFSEQTKEHSRILATVVERNIKNMLVSDAGLEHVIKLFLENSARFVSYLDEIERFSEPELTSFATESGLAGIDVIHQDGRAEVSGPQGWLPDGVSCSPGELKVLPDKHLFLYSMAVPGPKPQAGAEGCIIVGLASGEMEKLQRELSVEKLLQALSDLHGIAYVRLLPASDAGGDRLSVGLVRENGRLLSKTIFPMGSRQLVVALDADQLSERLRQMRRQFALFIAFLLFGGGLSTWWLFRMQRLRVKQARDFERELAREHEQAALGRAAETITHEMRNPLNAIGMGLQRLQLEAEGLAPDHRQLIVSMREAVERSNAIISDLRRYTHAFELVREPVDPAACLRQVITLYRPLCDDRSIRLDFEPGNGPIIEADAVLLGQVFENVIKNAVEAQPEGGFLRIVVKRSDGRCDIEIENGGCRLASEDARHVFEPYFTRKSKGTGLGLAIVRKIVEAHAGSCSCSVAEGRFTLTISLPVA